MNLKVVLGFVALLAVFFGSWLFAWPFVEAWYAAGSGWWPFIVENYFAIPHKLNLFLFGALLFFGGMYAGIRVVVS